MPNLSQIERDWCQSGLNLIDLAWNGPKVRYHFIANEMTKQIHYVFRHSDARLPICRVSSECPRLISVAWGQPRRWTALGFVMALAFCEGEWPSTLTVMHFNTWISSDCRHANFWRCAADASNPAGAMNHDDGSTSTAEGCPKAHWHRWRVISFAAVSAWKRLFNCSVRSSLTRYKSLGLLPLRLTRAIHLSRQSYDIKKLKCITVSILGRLPSQMAAKAITSPRTVRLPGWADARRIKRGQSLETLQISKGM